MAIDTIIDSLLKNRGTKVDIEVESEDVVKLGNVRFFLLKLSPEVESRVGPTTDVNGSRQRFTAQINVTPSAKDDVRLRLIQAFSVETVTINLKTQLSKLNVPT